MLEPSPEPAGISIFTRPVLIAHCPETTILFAELDDFSGLTEGLAAADVVKLLSGIYSRFVARMQKLGLESLRPPCAGAANGRGLDAQSPF